MRPEQSEFRRRAVRAALIVVAIAVGIGLLIGGLTTAALTGTDVLPEPTASPTPTTDAATPEPDPSPSLVETPSPTAPSPTAPSPTTSPSPTSATTSPTPSPTPRTRIELTVGAATAGSFEQVTLSGTYAGGDGRSLQVQRLEGGSWTAFPTTAVVEGGRFTTYVELGQPGPNRLRVVDPANGQTSNAVVVTIS